MRMGKRHLAHDERRSTIAWEQRGSQTYYDRSVRRHGMSRKEYIGTGPLAALGSIDLGLAGYAVAALFALAWLAPLVARRLRRLEGRWSAPAAD